MHKVTEANFRLPIIYPTEIVAELASGANRPLHIRGFDVGTHKKDEFVVKLKDSERMGDPGAFLRELVAALVAIEMDIPVAEPVVINITKELAGLAGTPSLRQRILNSVGLNFGSRYLGIGYQVLPTLSPIPHKLERQAQDILAFDLLVQNPDRTKEKPNMLSDGTRLIGFDHEFAFSFDKIVLAPKELWRQTGDLRRWVEDLILVPRLRGLEYDFDGFSQRMERLSPVF